jgi:hypothetical protein
MNKEETIKKYCSIANTVAQYKYKNEESSDCFCAPVGDEPAFSHSKKVAAYVRKAVNTQLLKDDGLSELAGATRIIKIGDHPTPQCADYEVTLPMGTFHYALRWVQACVVRDIINDREILDA